MILDRICSWLLPEEVEVGPLEVLIVKGKGEDCAEIVIIILILSRNITTLFCKTTNIIYQIFSRTSWNDYG